MSHVRDLFKVGPAGNDHHPAIRCALGVGLPLLVLLAIGRTDLTVFAVLGAFTSMFGRGEKHRERFTQQTTGAALLLIAVTAGEISSRGGLSPVLIVICTGLVAAIGSTASAFRRLRPQGAVFFVFAYSAIAFMEATPPPQVAVAVALASALTSLAIGSAGWLIPSHRTPWERDHTAPLTPEERRRTFAEAGLHFAAVCIAGFIALFAGFGHSYWAIISAAVPLVGTSAVHRVSRGVQRVLGTFGGLVIAGVLLSLALRSWEAIAVIIVLEFLAQLFIARNYSLGQLFITPLALMIAEVVQPVAPWLVMRDRAVETLIGATVGIVLVMVAARIGVWRRATA